MSATLFLLFRNRGPSWVPDLPLRQQPLWDEHAMFGILVVSEIVEWLVFLDSR